MKTFGDCVTQERSGGRSRLESTDWGQLWGAAALGREEPAGEGRAPGARGCFPGPPARARGRGPAPTTRGSGCGRRGGPRGSDPRIWGWGPAAGSTKDRGLAARVLVESWVSGAAGCSPGSHACPSQGAGPLCTGRSSLAHALLCICPVLSGLSPRAVTAAGVGCSQQVPRCARPWVLSASGSPSSWWPTWRDVSLCLVTQGWG